MPDYDINEHGVEGRLLRGGFTPMCCLQCAHYEIEYDEFRDIGYPYCAKNIWFPTRSGKCKRQRLVKPHTEVRE
jgi:hypothetical protein